MPEPIPAPEIERFVVDQIKGQSGAYELDSEHRDLERDLIRWHAEVRELGHASPARISQIMNLLQLALRDGSKLLSREISSSGDECLTDFFFDF